MSCERANIAILLSPGVGERAGAHERGLWRCKGAQVLRPPGRGIEDSYWLVFEPKFLYTPTKPVVLEGSPPSPSCYLPLGKPFLARAGSATSATFPAAEAAAAPPRLGRRRRRTVRPSAAAAATRGAGASSANLHIRTSHRVAATAQAEEDRRGGAAASYRRRRRQRAPHAGRSAARPTPTARRSPAASSASTRRITSSILEGRRAPRVAARTSGCACTARRARCRR